MRRSPLLVLIFLIGCKGTDSDKPIEIGHIFAGTHDDDEYRALNLAVDELNGDPARLPQGRKLRIRHAPGGSKPEEWGGQTTRLMSLNHVAGLVSAGQAEDVEKVGVAVQGDGVIAIGTAGWSTAPSQNLFTVGLAPTERGRALALYVKEKKLKTILIVREPAAKGAKLAADRFVADLHANGNRVSEVDVTAADKPAAEAVYFACSAKAALQHRPKNALLLFGDDPAELVAAGAAADGFVIATAYHPGVTTERMTAFAQKFQSALGRPPSAAAVLACDAFTIWVEAAHRANALESAPIRGELLNREKPFESLTGPLTFADDHTALRPVFVGRIAEGQMHEVSEFAGQPAN